MITLLDHYSPILLMAHRVLDSVRFGADESLQRILLALRVLGGL